MFRKCGSIGLGKLERQFQKLQRHALHQNTKICFKFSDLWFDFSRLPK
jgi:hypothetical protein